MEYIELIPKIRSLVYFMRSDLSNLTIEIFLASVSCYQGSFVFDVHIFDTEVYFESLNERAFDFVCKKLSKMRYEAFEDTIYVQGDPYYIMRQFISYRYNLPTCAIRISAMDYLSNNFHLYAQNLINYIELRYEQCDCTATCDGYGLISCVFKDVRKIHPSEPKPILFTGMDIFRNT